MTEKEIIKTLLKTISELTQCNYLFIRMLSGGQTVSQRKSCVAEIKYLQQSAIKNVRLATTEAKKLNLI